MARGGSAAPARTSASASTSAAPAIDKDCTAGGSTAVTAQRRKIDDSLQQLIRNDAPYVFLYTPDGLMAYDTALWDAASTAPG